MRTRYARATISSEDADKAINRLRERQAAIDAEIAQLQEKHAARLAKLEQHSNEIMQSLTSVADAQDREVRVDITALARWQELAANPYNGRVGLGGGRARPLGAGDRGGAAHAGAAAQCQVCRVRQPRARRADRRVVARGRSLDGQAVCCTKF